MTAKKSLGLNIAPKKKVATIATISVNGRYFTESKQSLIHVHFPQALIDSVEQCFRALGVTNTARYCEDGDFFTAPVVDFSEVWITPAAHQFFANESSNEIAYLLVLLTADRYLEHSQPLDRDFTALWRVLHQKHPIAACRTYFRTNRHEPLGIRTVMYVDDIEELSNPIAIL